MAVQAQAQPDLKAIMEYAGKLRDVLPLHILEQSDKEDLARQMHVRHFKADEVIYHQGDPAGDAHVVYQGLVKVMRVNAEGNEALVTLHRRGDFFGECALFNDSERDEPIIAVIPTTTLQLSRESCHRVLDRNDNTRASMFDRLPETVAWRPHRSRLTAVLHWPG